MRHFNDTIISRRSVFGLGGLGTLAAFAGCAPTQTAFQPSGRGIVDVVVPYSAGGGTDTWARFITPYFASLQREVERYQIENIPGGESITGTNAYARAKVVNGRQTLVASATTYFQSMLEHSVAEFDFAAMEPLALNGTGAVLWTSADTGITRAEDLFDGSRQHRYGGMSATGLDLVPLLALEALGADIRGVFGMEGRGPTRLAVQRGEADLDFQTTSSYLKQVKPLVDVGEAVPLFSIGSLVDGEVVRDPNIPDIPTVTEIFAKKSQTLTPTAHESAAFRALQAFVVPGFFYQKGLWANAGTDPAVIEKYAEMVDELNADDRFIAEAGEALGGYDLVSGKAARKEFRAAMTLDDEVLAFTKTLLSDKYGAVLD